MIEPIHSLWQNLHSTMLLLYLWKYRPHPGADKFTFHYASTLSMLSVASWAAFFKFTFHYASTLSDVSGWIICRSLSFTFHYASTLSKSPVNTGQWTTHLHSTMLLLYLLKVIPLRLPLTHLHSTMLLLYPGDCLSVIGVKLFTFHYASTLSWWSSPDPHHTRSFTFHYASTLSIMPSWVSYVRSNLHSTMLLLYPSSWSGSRGSSKFTFHYASTLSRPPFPLLFSSIQVYFLSTPLSSYLFSQKSFSSHFTKFKFSLIFQALSISQQFSAISGRQS